MRPIHVRVATGSIERIAARINDPVTRLRFLNAAVPASAASQRRARARLLYALVLLLVILPVSALLLLKGAGREPMPSRPAARLGRPAPRPPSPSSAQVWLVDKTADSEVYSNGLRVDTRFAVSNHLRGYLAFPLDSRGRGTGVRRSEAVGIVFHTTESRQAPFDPSENALLKRIGQSLLEYVREERAYHYLIDRFGRVYQVVRATDAANHAGYSVWADERWLYLNLNESFLGVSFESETNPGQTEGQFSPAQAHSAAMLIEMLRAQYRIPLENCVTHAQVSVNPRNMRVGYHTDWASGFPFERLGLPDNYRLEPPALWACGFESDPSYLGAAGARVYPAIALAEARVRQNAAESGIKLAAYRKRLQGRYRDWLAQVRRASGARDEEVGN
jgi:N-acetylmuramoyl-L-alanine amidase